MDINDIVMDALERVVHASTTLEKITAEVDSTVYYVVTMHFLLERELERAIAHFLPRSEKLGRLSFGHKVSVLEACVDHRVINVIAPQLVAFNNLRNAVAHHDTKEFRRCVNAMNASFPMPEGDDPLVIDDNFVPAFLGLHTVLQTIAAGRLNDLPDGVP